MAKIWVIEQGEYSDYGVTGVYSSLENAEAVLKIINHSGYSYNVGTIAEWELDPDMDNIKAGRKPYQICMLEDGSLPYEPEAVCGYYKEVSMGRAYIKGISEVIISGDVWATDETHAIKIMNEKRVQAIVNGEFDRFKS